MFLDVFFHGSGYSRSDPDFWPIRIRTQEKISDPDPEKTGSESLLFYSGTVPVVAGPHHRRWCWGRRAAALQYPPQSSHSSHPILDKE